MHDDIVHELGRQESETIVKVQVPFLGTASPPGLLLSYRYLSVRDAVHLTPVREARMHECTHCFHSFRIRLSPAPQAWQLNHSQTSIIESAKQKDLVRGLFEIN